MNKKVLIIIFLIAVSVGVYTASWFGAAKNIKEVLDNIKSDSNGAIKFDYEVYGFPFNVNISIKNFVFKVEAYDYTEKGGADPQVKKLLATVMFSGEVLLESVFLGSKTIITLPDVVTLDYGDGDIIECDYNSPAVFEVTYDIDKKKRLLASLGLDEIKFEDINSLFFVYNDSGATYYNQNKAEFGKYDNSNVGLNYNKDGSNLNASVKMSYENIVLHDAYYELYRKVLLKDSDGSEYQKKLTDYFVNFSKYTANTSFVLDVSFSATDVSADFKDFGAFNAVLNEFKISDKLGDTSLRGNINSLKSPDSQGNQVDFDIEYRMDSYQRIIEKYITFISNSISLLTEQNLVGKPAGVDNFIDGYSLNRKTLLALSSTVKSSLYDFFNKINAVEGDTLKIKAVLQPNQPVPLPVVNGYQAMQLMQLAQVSFSPVIVKLDEINKD